jgi:hypothetical protein
VEYAKAGAENLEIKISVINRGPEASTLHLLPTLWFRNTWMWSDAGSKTGVDRNQEGIHRDIGPSYWPDLSGVVA